jgi:hypothetical protein
MYNAPADAGLIILPQNPSNGDEGYLQSLLIYLVSAGQLPEETFFAVKEQLFALTGKQANSFTQGDSSSVTDETAQQLLQSIVYSIGAALKKAENKEQLAQTIQDHTMETLFWRGQEIIKAQTAQGQALLKAVQESRVGINNAVYSDTIEKSLPMFFKYYDIQFMAQEIPCDIDYPLYFMVDGLDGIEYILEYMQRLYPENMFCSFFPPENMERLLTAACPGYNASTVVNLFGPVFSNAVGLTMIHRDVKDLDISAGDRDKLRDMLQPLPQNERKRRILRAADALCATLSCPGLSAYLKCACGPLCVRLTAQLESQGGLEQIFVSFPKKITDQAYYQDGAQMPDEDLRQLINEISDCWDLDKQAAMVRERVHSIQDLTEVINACFDDAECVAIFELLSDAELAELLKVLYRRKGQLLMERNLNSFWENALLDYLHKRGLKTSFYQ